MMARSRTRLLLVVLLSALPVAASVSVMPSDVTSALPKDTHEPTTALSLHEHGFIFEGRVENPALIQVVGPDGKTAMRYAVDGDGRASLTVAGEPIVSDGTFVRMEGNPLDDMFIIYVSDPEGELHEVKVDRAALAALVGEIDVPDEAAPVVELLRPMGWPSAPTRSYLHFIEDAGLHRIVAGDLDGSRYLQRGVTHRAVIQIPVDDLQWDRMFLRASPDAGSHSINASFVRLPGSADAAVFATNFETGFLGIAEDGTVAVSIFYERRLTPVVVERHAEPITHYYKVDGKAPTVSLRSPATANNFSFPVSWDGADDGSGIGGFDVQWREAGSPSWNNWLGVSGKSGTFSGKWGAFYEFRAKAIDAVGNPSKEWVQSSTKVVAQGTDEGDVNDPPTVRFTAPRAGSLLSGVKTITWDASDPDGTIPSSTLEVSEDGQTWRTLYKGNATSATWDTTRETDGAGYRLRISTSDGTMSASDTVKALTIRNIVSVNAAPPQGEPAVPSAPTPSGGGKSGPESGAQRGTQTEDEVEPAEDVAPTKDTPAPFVGIAIVAAALLAARRRRA